MFLKITINYNQKSYNRQGGASFVYKGNNVISLIWGSKMTPLLFQHRSHECVFSTALTAAAFTKTRRTKRRMLTSSDNWHTLIYIWVPGVCIAAVGVVANGVCVCVWRERGGHMSTPRASQKQTLGTLLLALAWPAGWVGAEGKQTKYHSLPAGDKGVV